MREAKANDEDLFAAQRRTREALLAALGLHDEGDVLKVELSISCDDFPVVTVTRAICSVDGTRRLATTFERSELRLVSRDVKLGAVA